MPVLSFLGHRALRTALLFGVSVSLCSVTCAQVLTVRVTVEPSSDAGLFNLLVDNHVVAQSVGSGFSWTSPVRLPPGLYRVAETAGRATNLGDYTVTIGGDCRADGTVDVRGGNATCEVRNVRLPPPQPAQLTIDLSVGPAGDRGHFNVQLDRTTVANNQASGGIVGPLTVPPGPDTVSDTGATGTDPSQYVLAIGGACAPNGSIVLASGDDKTCTLLNTKKPPSQLTVKTTVGPPGDPGLFTITVDEAVVGNNLGNNGVLGPQVESAGLHVVGETGGSGTDTQKYVVLIGGDCSPDGSINLNLGDNKTCTIANTRGAQAIVPTDSVNGLTTGKTQGTASVSKDGAALYEVKLWVPPGRAGIEPQLSLAYNSRGENGLEGVGWALTGFLEITRCRRTLLQDGEATEVSFTDGEHGDRYCLNGQRLVAVGGSNGIASVYGADGTEYRTENDTHTKIVSYSPDTYGPTYFRVYQKDGRIMTLGSGTAFLEGERVSVSVTGASPWGSTGYAPPTYQTDYTQHVRYGWYLSRMEDRSGNFLTIDYKTLGSATAGYEIAPVAIHYAGSSKNAALVPTRHVNFAYEPRTDFEEHYVSGFHVIQVQRLHALEMMWGTNSLGSPTTIRTYTLEYASNSISGRSLLTSLQECDGAQICKPPTKFEWSPGLTSFKDSVTSASSGMLSVGDIDGDGLDDLLVGGASFYRSTGSGFAAALPTNIAGPYAPPNTGPIWTRLIDLNARGAFDVAWLSSPKYPSGFQPPVVPVYKNQFYFWDSAEFAPRVNLAYEIYNPFPRPDYWIDLDGDGRPDSVRPGPSTDVFGNPSSTTPIYGNPGGPTWEFRLNNNGSPLGLYTTSTVLNGQPQGPYQPISPGGSAPVLRTLAMGVDLNGSGRASLLVSGDRLLQLKALTYSGQTLHTVPTTFLGEGYGFCDPIFVDLNGDGLLDWVSVSPTGGIVNVSINTGNGFAAPIQWTAPAPYNSSPSLACDVHNDTGIRVIDFNQDGHQDLLLMGGFTPTGSKAANLVVLEWTPGGFTVVPLPIPVGASTSTSYLQNCAGPACGIGVWGQDWSSSQVLDLDGHGLGDLLQIDNSTPNYHVWIRQGIRADLLTDVIDGFGVWDRFSYSPLIDGSVYQPASDCKYPQLCVKRGPWVVSEHSVQTGSPAVVRDLRYSYGDGRTDVSGRGWVGFARVSELEAARSTVIDTMYDNQTRVGTFYPCANQPVESNVDVALDADTHRVIRVSEKCQIVTEHDDRIYFAYIASLVRKEWEIKQGNGVLLSENSEKTREDDFGNITESDFEIYDVDASQPSGRSEQLHNHFAYDNFEPSWLVGQLMHSEQTTVDRDGHSVKVEVTYDYQPDTGLLARVVREPNGQFTAAPNASDFYRESQIERNVYGLPTTITSRGSGQVRKSVATYDSSEFMFVESFSNALHQTYQYSYEPSQGLLLSATDPNGVPTQYSYDGFGRLRFVYPADGANEQIHYVWDSQGRPEVTNSRSGGTLFHVSFDGQRRPLLQQWLGFGAIWVSSETGYDRLGRISFQSLPHFVTDAPVPTTFAYDNMDRMTVRLNPDGSSDSRAYTGLRTDSTDANANRSYLIRDGLGRIRVSALLGSSSREVITRFGYKSGEFLGRITDASGNVVSLEYDKLGRRTVLRDLDAGNTTTQYNAFDELKEQVDGDGRNTSYDRDLLGRPQKITSADGVTTLVWDTSPNGIGELASSTSTDGIKITYLYNGLSKLQQQSSNINGTQYGFQYAYDAFGRPWRLTYPAVGHQALTVQRNYTNQGELQSISDVGQQHMYWTAAGRNASEELTSEIFANSVTTTHMFDPELRLRGITTLSGTNPLQCIAYGDDSSDNVTSRDMTTNSACHTPQGPNLSAGPQNAPVDWANRVATWSSLTPSWSVAYKYDDIGNLKGQSGSVVPIPPQMDYTYGGGGAGVHAVTQITSGSSVFNYKYDPAGNQIIAPTRQIRFTSMNLPSRITSAQHDVKYKYDAFGNRALKQDVTTGGATTYVNGLFEKRTASGTTNYVLYLPVENRIIGEILMGGAGSTAGAQTFYFHDDLLGSIETVSDSAGNGIERFAYSSFGVKRSQVPASGQPEIRLGFTGAQEDKEFGLVNLVGRIYDPQIGRFLSPDPFVPHPYSGQSYNRYSYVLNNPLTMTDPNGFQDGEDTSQPTRGADFGPSTITGSTSQDTSQPTRSANFGPSVITGSPSPGPPANTSDDTGTHADSGPSNVPANLSPPRVPLAPLFRPLAIQQGADLARTGYERGNYAITASRNAGGVIKQVQSNELTPSAGEELAVQLRRDLEGQTRSNLPSWAAELSAARNLERYGDPLGPATPDLARVRPGGGPPKTPMEVMRSSGKTSAVWNAAGIVAGVAGTVLVIENWLNMAFTATDRGYIPSGAFNVVVDPSKIPNGTQTLDWPGVSTPGVFWNGEFRPYTHMEPGVGTPVPDML